MLTKFRALTLGMLAAVVITVPAQAVKHYDILMAGYYNGPSVSGTIGFNEIFDKVPVGFELGLGYSWTPTGPAILACQVFINQNQNNNPENINSGGVLDLGLNATYPLIQTYKNAKFGVFGGPRWARYDVRHEYVNGNEDFNITSYVYGLGGGLRGSLPLSEHFTAILQLGLDYYFRSSIYGHDATYYPDNSNINARNNGQGYTYTYDDALRATTVPHIRPRVMVGIQF